MKKYSFQQNISHFLPIMASIWINTCIVIVCTTACVTSFSKENPQGVSIKVLLDTQLVDRSKEWELTSSSGFHIQDPEQPSKRIKTSVAHISISTQGTHLLLNGKKTKCTQMVIAPADGMIEFQAKRYKGAFLFVVYNNALLCINKLDLEEYIACVLATESWPGWPLEINKTLAIACRSYAVATMVEAHKSKLPYHIKNTNSHQTYKGAHSNKKLYDAVHQTKGMLLMHNNKPALAMFDICCGGIIPAKIQDFDFSKVPYLARQKACTYCKKSSSVFSWKAQYDVQHLHHVFHHLLPSGSVLKDIKISKKDKAGKVQELTLHASKKTVPLSIKQLYTVCKDKVKSYCFSVKRKGNSIHFEGKGFGHHLGLCQWGARHMVDDGWDYASILRFYYPGTTLARMCS